MYNTTAPGDWSGLNGGPPPLVPLEPGTEIPFRADDNVSLPPGTPPYLLSRRPPSRLWFEPASQPVGLGTRGHRASQPPGNREHGTR